MKIVLAPDSYKECLTADEVTKAMADAVLEHYPGAEVVRLPLADGGEGTLDVLAKALGAQIHETTVTDPLERPVTARYGVIGETAFIEIAQACGLSLLHPSERNPLLATSRGVGELLMAAYAEGCRHFIVGLGGSATCDGGSGMLEAPGFKEIKGVSVELLCDVDAPFVGSMGAARVFAPQKGASAQDVEMLESRMVKLADVIHQETGVDVSNLPGAGAAGGLGGAFMAYLDAKMVNGVNRIMDFTGFDEACQDATLIVTGEGKSDAQTLMGKVPMGVLIRAKGVPVALLSGRVENQDMLERAGFSPIVEVSPRNLPLSQSMNPTFTIANLQKAVKKALLFNRFGGQS